MQSCLRHKRAHYTETFWVEEKIINYTTPAVQIKISNSIMRLP